MAPKNSPRPRGEDKRKTYEDEHQETPTTDIDPPPREKPSAIPTILILCILGETSSETIMDTNAIFPAQHEINDQEIVMEVLSIV